MKHIFILLISLFCLKAQAQTDTTIYTVQVINADSITLVATVYPLIGNAYRVLEDMDSTVCADRIILLDSLRIQDSLSYRSFETRKLQMETLEKSYLKDYNIQTILRNLLQTNQP